MEAFTYLDTAVRHWQQIAAVILVLIGQVLLVNLVTLLLNRRYLKQRDMVWLEITPPASISKTPEATEQLFSVIHGLRAARNFKHKILRRAPVVSFEIVSRRRDGIRYLLHIESHLAGNVQKAITAYIPDSKVKQVEREVDNIDHVTEFKETAHYVLPLTLTSMIEQHDPLSYVTSAMTELSDDEQITLQLVAMPVRLREASILSHRILGNENILEQVRSTHFSILGKLGGALGKVSSGLTDTASEVYAGTTQGYQSYYRSKGSQSSGQPLPVTKLDRPSRTLSAFELELMETMHQKVTEPLFQVNLRVLITSPSSKTHAAAFRSALDGFSVPMYQSLRAKMGLPIVKNLRQQLAVRRLPSLFRRSAMVLSSSELASLYHFPPSQISRTDNLITSLSRTLPAPISLKQNREFDVVIGENSHHGLKTLIGLTEQERQRHAYIIGGTGNGKTTMLQYQIVQDMQNGKGVAILDPHGDMAETLLRYVPKERIKDVVYFNPDDLEYPFALNLLELTPGLEGNDLLREKDIITESVISVFRKIFSDDDSGGHRIEYVLRNAIHTALTVENATLFTILKLLQNATFRRDVTNKLTDEDLKDFWKNELGKAGDMQKVKMSAGITAKIGRFNVNAATKAILGEPKSTIDFEDIMDSEKIFICNLSKGILGEDVSELFGITILAKLQLASLRRARVKQALRKPYYLYVDEFQNFATPSFIQMLSEARKYKLFLTMAEQSTSQQDDQQMVSVILANVGTVIVFRTGNPNDEKLLLPLFAPYIGQGEIANLNAYNFYARLSSVIAQEPLSGVTLLLESSGDEAVVNRVIKASRKQYAQKPKPETVATPEPINHKSRTRKPPERTNAPKATPKPAVKMLGHQ